MRNGVLKGLGNKRVWLLSGVGVLLGRVWVYGMNPIAIPFMALGCMEGTKGYVMVASVFLGMISRGEISGIIKYGMIWLVLDLGRVLWKRYGKGELSATMVAGGSAVVTAVISMSGAVLTTQLPDEILKGAVESILAFSLVIVFHKGIRFFLYESSDKIPTGEEVISLIILGMGGLYGIPHVGEGIFSVGESLAYLGVLWVSYRFGPSMGGIAGVAAGICAVLGGEELAVVSLYAILGIGSGMVRRGGKVVVAAFFLAAGALISVAMAPELITIVQLRGIGSAAILFLGLPKAILQPMELGFYSGEGREFAREDVRNLANYRLDEIATAFRKLAGSFERYGKTDWNLYEEDSPEYVHEISERVCKECQNGRFCWENHFDEAWNFGWQVVGMAAKEPGLAPEDVHSEFGCRCLKLPEYVEHANEIMRRQRFNQSMNQRLQESREAVGRQMLEVSGILKDFTKDLTGTREVSGAKKKELADALSRVGLRIRKLSIWYNRRDHLAVRFTGKRKGQACVTKNDVAKILANVFHIAMRPVGETKNVVGLDYDVMEFVEDTKFKVLTGLARVARTGERVSGDNYSFLELSSGEMLMILSDGMGSGEGACRDSESLVEVMENLLEAGFHKESAIELLNALFVLSYEGRSFSTLDLTSIDLYSGKCEMLKNGAAATFVRRGKQVETIQAGALPVGVEPTARCSRSDHELGDGDFVVMVTDGILDAFPGENKEFYVENILENLNSNNPGDIANTILMKAIERGGGESEDDMSVLALGIWSK